MPAGGILSWPAPFVVSVGKAPEGSRTNRRTTDSPMPMYNGYFQEKRRMSACLSVKGRKAPPYHIAMAGLCRPLTEPGMHLSMHPARRCIAQLHFHSKSMMYFWVTVMTYHQCFSAFCDHNYFPRFFSFQIFHLVHMMHLIFLVFSLIAT